MDQAELTSIFCSRPQNFAWFLGAGTSRSAGLPTATDIIWDLKRRYYCREENQEIDRQDIQNNAVKSKIQAFMDSKGFPELWADEEYSDYFEKIFGDDKERQRKYLKAILSEDKVTLSVGNRVFGALLVSDLCKIAFTTNFDSVVEKAVAEVGGQSLAAYHLEGSHGANEALNNEEYPIYSKIHGDFRYDSLKNLSKDLATQNEKLANCLVNAGNRFGFFVAGYSGRDQSVMELFRSILDTNNPFPHGLYWTGIKGSKPLHSVVELLSQAKEKGVSAEYVEIETFDALMLRLWRNIENKLPDLDKKVRKSDVASVHIPLPVQGIGNPILRLNALPVISLPQQCLSLSFRTPKEWSDLRQARHDATGRLIFTKSDTVYCWGVQNLINDAFGNDILEIKEQDLPTNIHSGANLHIKSFLEEALCTALSRDKPLLSRTTRSSSFLIVDPHSNDKSALDALHQIVGNTSGIISGLFAPATDDKPHPEKVAWAEAIRVTLDIKDGKFWLMLDPDIWIWPPRARRCARTFLDRRRGDRFNEKYNTLLDAWVHIILGASRQNSQVILSAFEGKNKAENPHFTIGSRTAFSRRLTV